VKHKYYNKGRYLSMDILHEAYDEFCKKVHDDEPKKVFAFRRAPIVS
jgi:hypothetical protein